MRYTMFTALAVGVAAAGLSVTGDYFTTNLSSSAMTGSLGLDRTPAARTMAIVDIAVPVSTAFGLYTPNAIPKYRAEVGLNEPTIGNGFSNVATSAGRFPWDNYFTASERTLLQKNSLVARAEGVGSFAQAYMLGSPELGSFVTVDAVLHGLRVTTEEGYREMERSHMAPNLESVLSDLSKSLSSQLAGERNPQLASAFLRLLAYVQTAHLLMEPSAAVDPRVGEAVQAELDNIAAGRSAASAIFPDRRIDYSRFSPEGRYTLDRTLSSYYQARTWLGAISFEIRNSSAERDLLEMRMATLLARTMDMIAAQGDFKDRYMAVYEPLGFFNGRSEADVSWDMLAGALRGYYGQLIMGSTSSLADNKGLAEFAPYLQRQLPVAGKGARGFRFLGESASTGLIGERIQGAARGGSAVSIMAALGNERATGIVGAGSVATLAKRPAEEWVQSLNNSILYTVSPLLNPVERSNGYPRFMRSDAWYERELGSALGAWTSYQGTLLMQQMQSSARVSTSRGGGGDLETAGYVEPNPEAWSRLASLAGYLRSGFVGGPQGSVISRRIEEKLRDIETASLEMMKIAAAELQGTELTSQQNDIVASMPSRIAAYETFTNKSLKGEGSPLVATASGDISATGHPLVMYVIVPRNDGMGGLMLTRGAVYSYFENGSRAEQWKSMITTNGTEIIPPAWSAGYISSAGSFAQSPSRFQSIEGVLPSAIATAPASSAAERRRLLSAVELDIESNVVRRSSGELWFTVRAPQMNGSELHVTVVDNAGSVVYTATAGRIEGGKRLDMVRVDGLNAGQYFLRVSDITNRVLASGRFMVVR